MTPVRRDRTNIDPPQKLPPSPRQIRNKLWRVVLAATILILGSMNSHRVEIMAAAGRRARPTSTPQRPKMPSLELPSWLRYGLAAR
jgi:hypothetical protein